MKIERLIDPEPGVLYPRLTEATGHCPPEEVGGPWGYAEFLEAIDDPNHERYAEFREWIGDDFDPNVVDAEALANEVARSHNAGRAKRRPNAHAECNPRCSLEGYEKSAALPRETFSPASPWRRWSSDCPR